VKCPGIVASIEIQRLARVKRARGSDRTILFLAGVSLRTINFVAGAGILCLGADESKRDPSSLRSSG
jgi:hypothetical protein